MLSSSSESRRSKLDSDLQSDLVPHRPKRLKTFDKDILHEQTSSGLRLANQVFSTSFETNENAVLSPLSIHIALSMVAAGASGHVKEQIISFLGANSEEQLHSFALNAMDVIFSDSSVSGGPKLSAANAIWLDDTYTFKSAFKQAMETDHKADTKLLDFTKVDESVSEVNEWAEKATNGLIKSIVDSNSFNSDTVLVLANALYFKGTWVDKFSPEFTEKHDFYLMDGSSVSVPFMSSREDRAVGTYDTFKVLNLPYRKGKGRRFSMSIFLPNDKDGLAGLMERVCRDRSFLERHIPKTEVEVEVVRIPKFKIEFNFNVKDVLKEMGLEIGLLTEAVEEMQEELGPGGLIVSDIVQKAFVEVDEEGTKAAVVTYCSEDGCCGPQEEEIEFIADHPFMFVIRDDSTGLVLFVGRVLDPSL